MKSNRTQAHKGLIKIIFPVILALWSGSTAQALSPDFYATNSLLSEGVWVKVSITESGMHMIPDATLRNLGFSDPKKVRVYGSGGAMLPEGLWAGMTDDLPPVVSVHGSKGLVFYAENHISWQPGDGNGLPYSHTINPYTHESYYFLSDRENGHEFGSTDMRGEGATTAVSFTEHVLHEQELMHLGESGRTYVGEDFRANKSQTMRFELPDGVEGDAMTYNIRFASKTTGGTSGVKIRANGTEDAEGELKIGGSGSESYGNLVTLSSTTDSSDKLELNLEYNYSGVLFLANLDYIEVFYERQLKLRNGELAFQGSYQPNTTLVVAGAEESTEIWDITDRNNPVRVTYDLSEGNARLTVRDGAYHEYVAFTPDKVTRTAMAMGRVANQDLHSLPAPDMLIISNPQYREGAEKIAAMHREKDGMDVLILDPAKIYNEFSGGKPDVTAWRKLLKMWHDRGKTPGYCLIMGKPSYDNKFIDSKVRAAGYKPELIWQSVKGLSETTSYSNDDYIGMLDDAEPDQFQMGRATIHVAVGRLPVKNAAESLSTAEKIVKHVTDPNTGPWRNKVMLIADDGDNSAHFNQAQTCYTNMRSQGQGSNYKYDRLYLDSYHLTQTPTGAAYPQATAKMLNNFNEGVALTDYIGHASKHEWGHEQLWTWKQICDMSNPNLMFIYAATCRFTPWDEPDESAGEVLMLNPTGGVSGMIMATRTVYISQNGELNRRFAKEAFKTGDDGRLRRLGDIYIAAKNAYSGDENKLRYAFMGDPAMRLTDISYEVSVDYINGVETATAEEYPIAEGGSRLQLSGTVKRPDGTEASEFNGTVTLQLYDAETVIETNGNGSSGKKELYNDRKLRLALVTTTVRNGRWNATLNVPLEISNNYQPALISAYASDNERREANGYSESLYVYGYSDEDNRDTEGPQVEHFYLNRENFKNGEIVNPNPVVFIRLSDPSGINLSDAGIGHKLTLRLDNNAPYDDVPQYFTQDIDGTGGTIIYGLKDLAPGRHELTLEAWDNLNNSTRKTLDFQVSANADPYIVNIGTDCNPATSGVTFTILLDQPNTMMQCNLTVYDLNGKKIWENSMRDSTGSSSSVNAYWNLTDGSGNRVPRGIYLYKARVETPQGTWSTKTNKLAVTAQ